MLVDCVAKICCDTLEESFANVPAFVHAFPFFLFAFLRVGGGGVVNYAILGVWFCLLDICADASLMVVFIGSYYFC